MNTGFTVAQKFEQNLAELAFKRQKLEDGGLEKRVEILRLGLERRRIAGEKRQREKERHEMMMVIHGGRC